MTFLAVAPLRDTTGPVKVWVVSWALLWTFDATLGRVFVSSFLVDTLVLTANFAFILGAAMVTNFRYRQTTFVPRKDFIFSRGLTKPANMGAALVGWAVLEIGARQAAGTSLLNIFSLGPRAALQLLNTNYVTNIAQSDEQFFGVKAASIVLVYLSMFAGFRIAAGIGRGFKAKIGLLNFVAFLFGLTVVSGSRSTMIVGFVFAFFSYVSYATYLSGGRRVFSGKQTRNTILVIVALAAFVITAQSIRLGGGEFTGIGRTLDYMRPWFAGYLPSLTFWFDNIYNGEALMGRNLLRAFVRQIPELSNYGANGTVPIGEYRTSNASTIFRLLWRDFTPVGAVLFCGVWGAVSQTVFVRCKNQGGIWVVLNAANLAAVMFSINSWYFGYGSRVIGVVAVFAIVYLAGYRFIWRQQTRSC